MGTKGLSNNGGVGANLVFAQIPLGEDIGCEYAAPVGIRINIKSIDFLKIDPRLRTGEHEVRPYTLPIGKTDSRS